MIYVHVPFCRSFCTYCGFYSEVAPKCRRDGDERIQNRLFEEFGASLSAEIRERKQVIDRVLTSGGVNTLYLGGGTPSVMPLPVYETILAALTGAGVETSFDEFTIEVNPEDIVEKGIPYVEGLLRLGVNRISMGVQSFDDSLLKFMNRRHTAEDARKAYHILESAGVENISIDLIFGLEQLSDDLWRQTIEKAFDVSSRGALPPHISAYQLSVEPGSMLEKLMSKGKWQEASDELCEHQYGILCEALARAGYNHYEISNFAQPGFEARHNSAYWRHIPYIGLGPGAHSFVPADGCGEFERQWNKDDLKGYLQAGKAGDFSLVRGGERLTAEQIALEKVMLGLRTSTGLQEETLRGYCGSSAVDEAIASGHLIRIAGGYVRIPEDRFFISDSIILNIYG